MGNNRDSAAKQNLQCWILAAGEWLNSNPDLEHLEDASLQVRSLLEIDPECFEPLPAALGQSATARAGLCRFVQEQLRRFQDSKVREADSSADESEATASHCFHFRSAALTESVLDSILSRIDQAEVCAWLNSCFPSLLDETDRRDARRFLARKLASYFLPKPNEHSPGTNPHLERILKPFLAALQTE